MISMRLFQWGKDSFHAKIGLLKGLKAVFCDFCLLLEAVNWEMSIFTLLEVLSNPESHIPTAERLFLLLFPLKQRLVLCIPLTFVRIQLVLVDMVENCLIH